MHIVGYQVISMNHFILHIHFHSTALLARECISYVTKKQKAPNQEVTFKCRYSVFGSLVHFIWLAKVYKGFGIIGQIRCLQSILAQMQFPAQKAPRFRLSANQTSGQVIPCLSHYCTNFVKH